MRLALATAATLAIGLSAMAAPAFAKAHMQPADRAEFGQSTANAAITAAAEKKAEMTSSTTTTSTASTSTAAPKTTTVAK